MRDRATHPRYGDRTACRVCGADIEYHGATHGWIDRGGNTTCDQSGMATDDKPLPKTKHKPGRDA